MGERSPPHVPPAARLVPGPETWVRQAATHGGLAFTFRVPGQEQRFLDPFASPVGPFCVSCVRPR